MDFTKFLTKEAVIIAIVVFGMIIQSNYFATKLDLANLKLEMSQMQTELQTYSDNNDKELQKEVGEQYKVILEKIERLRR